MKRLIFAVFGPPSGFTQYAVALLRIMTDVTVGKVDYLTANTVEEMKRSWQGRRFNNLFFFSDCPEHELMGIFLRLENLRPIILLEDPADIAAYAVRERGLSWLWAGRLANQTIVTISDLLSDPGTLVLKREYELTCAEFLTAAARHVGIPLSPDDIVSVLTRMDPEGRLAPETLMEDAMLAKLPNARPSGISNPPEEAVGDALDTLHEAMRGLVSSRRMPPMTLPPQILISDDQVLSEPIEMLGPARCLCYGPYLYLPRGDWRAQIDFHITGNESGNVLFIDVYHGEVLGGLRVEMPVSGTFSGEVYFRVRDPREAIQIRLIMMEGAIEGVLTVTGISFSEAEDGWHARPEAEKIMAH